MRECGNCQCRGRIVEFDPFFREEQADEYTTIRKNLEQCNKNCRILSFKLRKIERKAEQLEADKTDLEKKYDQVITLRRGYE